jgi:hypothetical protein
MKKSISENDILNFIYLWFKSTETNNPSLPNSFFDDKFVLFATLSNKFITSKKERLDYFKYFLSNPNLKNKMIDYKIINLDKNVWGFYSFVNWTFDSNNKKNSIIARMSFIVTNDKGHLKIKSLHSSELPKK